MKESGILYKSRETNGADKWDLSSAGRASALQAEGHRFEPYRSHFLNLLIRCRMPAWRNWQTHRT